MLTNDVYLYTFCFMESIEHHFRNATESGANERQRMYRRLAAGELQRVLPGVMLESDVVLTDARVMSLLYARRPDAVMNLISALSHHKMTTQIPDALSVALPRGVRMPPVYGVPVQVWYTSPALLKDCAMLVQGEFGDYRVTTPERTLVDCFKYRNKIGLSIFLEAVRMGQGKLNPSRIHYEATRLRVLNNMLPYLKSFFV